VNISALRTTPHPEERRARRWRGGSRPVRGDGDGEDILNMALRRPHLLAGAHVPDKQVRVAPAAPRERTCSNGERYAVSKPANVKWPCGGKQASYSDSNGNPFRPQSGPLFLYLPLQWPRGPCDEEGAVTLEV